MEISHAAIGARPGNGSAPARLPPRPGRRTRFRLKITLSESAGRGHNATLRHRAVLGKGHPLTMKAGTADKGSMVSGLRASADHVVRKREREAGQALVEFALVAPVFLLIVAGVIQFGVALNFWFDMNRIAHQGARWAAVNCGQSATVPAANPCIAEDGTQNIEAALRDDVVSRGNDTTVEVCWVETTGSPAGTVAVGDPVRVQLVNTYEFVPLVGIDVELRATTTMRVEQKPSSPGPLDSSVVEGPSATPGTACPLPTP